MQSSKIRKNLSNVLKYRSSYFRQELENIQPNENNIKTINKPNVSAKIFDVILKEIETGFIFDLMLAAKKFELEELSNKLETFLIETHLSIVSRRLLTEKILNGFKIFNGQRKISHTIDYSTTTFTTYSLFSTLNIEIYDKIKPYKKILDKQLWEDINQHSFAPERPVKSTILPPRPILMGLLHKRCHGHTRTVVVAKVKGTDEIIGGYNPLAWDSACYGEYRWMETKDSFIFSLKMGIFKIQFLAEQRIPNTQFLIYAEMIKILKAHILDLIFVCVVKNLILI
ncbi:hypothetical protein Glove_139g287 [Diversispora epigaea]|uniref:BTB domain-containing protein n=1 Tax=Diversispora epigaea TaxID=1348612 RepID=A0A397J254_9GLOM|nr:hypothetical protein Glove_139g287 [Diversispora epigaea]